LILTAQQLTEMLFRMLASAKAGLFFPHFLTFHQFPQYLVQEWQTWKSHYILEQRLAKYVNLDFSTLALTSDLDF